MFGGEIIFRRVGLCLLEPKLQLVEQPRRALGARSVNRAPQLFDLKIEMRDQRATLRQFRDGRHGARLLRRSFGPRRNQRRFQRIEVVRKRGKIGVHEITWNHKIGRLRRPFLRFFSRFFSYPTAFGRHVSCGMRQSMPDSR